MRVKDHFLYDDNDVRVTYKASPNHGGLKKDNRFIVIHYDGSPNATGAIGWMLDPKAKVSAELHITRDGKITQLVPFNITAWHAGQSEWKGVIGLNSHSIGIELQNAGNQEYTQIQLDTLVKVCKALVEEYHEEEIVGHSDIAPKRKIDPGVQFPWKWFKEQMNMTNEVNIATTTSDLNLRVGAGTQYSKISILPKGIEVNILNEANGWSYVLVSSTKMKGYVSSKYLTKK